MKLEITLEKYLELGGKLDKVNWSDTRCSYLDSNTGENIISYEDKGEKSSSDTPLYHFTFENGKTHRYAICWIKMKVDVVLAETYR